MVVLLGSSARSNPLPRGRKIYTGEEVIAFAKVLKKLKLYNRMQRDKVRSRIANPLLQQLEALMAQAIETSTLQPKIGHIPKQTTPALLQR